MPLARPPKTVPELARYLTAVPVVGTTAAANVIASPEIFTAVVANTVAAGAAIVTLGTSALGYPKPKLSSDKPTILSSLLSVSSVSIPYTLFGLFPS